MIVVVSAEFHELMVCLPRLLHWYIVVSVATINSSLSIISNINKYHCDLRGHWSAQPLVDMSHEEDKDASQISPGHTYGLVC